jgi:hypothetical protein
MKMRAPAAASTADPGFRGRTAPGVPSVEKRLILPDRSTVGAFVSTTSIADDAA